MAGEWRADQSGNIYQLVYFATTCSYGFAVQSVTASTNVGYHVGLASVTGVKAAGVLNQIATTGTIAAGVYAWVQRWGTGVASVKASYAVNLHLIPSTDGGLLSGVATIAGAYRAGATYSSVTTGNQTVMINML
jgi:hypothetical protein